MDAAMEGINSIANARINSLATLTISYKCEISQLIEMTPWVTFQSILFHISFPSSLFLPPAPPLSIVFACKWKGMDKSAWHSTIIPR